MIATMFAVADIGSMIPLTIFNEKFMQVEENRMISDLE